MIKQKINIKPLSVNKLWQGRRFKTNSYKDFEHDLIYSLKNFQKPQGELKLSVVFGISNRNQDLDNLLKGFIDVLQKKYDFNDRDIYFIDIEKTITKKGKEFIDFELTNYS